MTVYVVFDWFGDKFGDKVLVDFYLEGLQLP